MIFTVVAYIPLLEEETAHKKIEFPKKTDTDSGADSDEDETDSDAKTLFGSGMSLDWNLSGKDYKHLKGFHHYFCLMEDNLTPPPRS